MELNRCRFLAAAFLAAVPLIAQTTPRDRITQAVDDRETVRLSGNRPPLARAEFDRGAVPSNERMEQMILLLTPDPARQSELDQLVEAQTNPSSPLYHRWITPQEYGSRFGVSPDDLDQVQAWLTRSGFQIVEIPASARSIIFSGTAGQVTAAFHTEIHRYAVNGEIHRANASDPEIPSALAQVVTGVVSLHDFFSRPALGSAAPAFTSGSAHYMSPADFATIYDLNPLYSNSIDGTGTSIAVVARSNINLADITAFRTQMGLPVNNPTVILNGADPGVVSGGEQTEATLDVEWAGAVAKKTTVKVVVSASAASDGALLSAQYIVNHAVAPVMTTSFSVCEAAAGTTYTQFLGSLWQQAAAEGITSFVASGDSGAAGCDSDSASTATQGKGVSALASSPYDVAVGGTEFNDATSSNLYWSANTNTTNMGSALTYIPEFVWNDSGTTSGGSGLWASGGGASTVFARPAWQTGTGVPSGTMRDLPDVAATASTHDGYLVLMNGSVLAAGGTSAATPAWAGIMALIVQRAGSPQGNANPNLYALARLQSSGGAAVFHDITAGNNSVPGVPGFSAGPGYDEATGLGSPDAFQLVQHWSGTPVPSLSLTVSSPAAVAAGSSTHVSVTTTVGGGFSSTVALSVVGLPAGLAASFSPANIVAPGSGSSTLTLSAAAGITAGSYTLNVTATGGGLIQTAPLALSVTVPGFSFSIAPAALSFPQAGSGQIVLTVTPAGALASATSITVSGLPSGVTAASIPSTQAGSLPVILVASGTAAIGPKTLTFSITSGGVTKSTTVALTITALPFTISANLASSTIVPGGSVNVTISVTSSAGFTGPVTLAASGVPAGVTVSFAPSSLSGSGKHTSILHIAAATTSKTLTAPITVIATGGGVTQMFAFPITVSPAHAPSRSAANGRQQP